MYQNNLNVLKTPKNGQIKEVWKMGEKYDKMKMPFLCYFVCLTPDDYQWVTYLFRMILIYILQKGKWHFTIDYTIFKYWNTYLHFYFDHAKINTLLFTLPAVAKMCVKHTPTLRTFWLHRQWGWGYVYILSPHLHLLKSAVKLSKTHSSL